MNDTEFELSKMAVTTDVQGLGIGRKLMEHCMKAAKENQIKKDYYLFQQKTSTISLYKKFGFEEVPLDDCIYERADIKMEKLILQ
jgi:N-acetylglutamate synthase-like GNAT family acetyltransferase